MAKEVLVVPEHRLEQVVRVIRAGLAAEIPNDLLGPVLVELAQRAAMLLATRANTIDGLNVLVDAQAKEIEELKRAKGGDAT